MNITIHRGTDQIGGCVTEYEYKGWRLFVDYGEQLPGIPKTPLKVEGLTHGDLSKSALLITHYHSDHVGCIADLPKELPIYMGQTAKEILDGLSNHIGYADEKQRALNVRLNSVKTFSPGHPFEWGKFQIMPIVIDHSAFDAYAFRIEAGGLKVFHSGDFRTHGFRGRKLPQVIEKYVGRVDYMVCEATNVRRYNEDMKSEHDLQKEFTEAFTANKYNVVYLSSTNIDRLFGLYHAALRASRPFYVDEYQKKMMDIVVASDHVWGKSRLYKYKEGRDPIVLQREGDRFRVNEKFMDFLSDQGYVLIARGGNRFDDLLSRIPFRGRKTYFSMWEGYLDKSKPTYNPVLAQSVSCPYEYFHTSGHCDMDSVKKLVEMLNPKIIIPIHTDAPQSFAELFCDKWPVLIMEDGETFRPIKETGFDHISATIFAKETLKDDIQVVANPENMEVWSLDEQYLGAFSHKEDALWTLRHTIYSPERLLGYAVEDVEDMSPCDYKLYDTDFNLLSSYTKGGHFPNKENWQEKSGYDPGSKMYALYYYPFYVVLPCEVIGPITEKFVRKQFKEDEFTPASSYKEYVKGYSDWDWDTVIVKPLVHLKKEEYREIPEQIDVNRVYLFPFK